jgi:CheY-like chemotaxis protein
VKRILIVDDDEGFHEAVDAALSLHGFGVEHASNGREALAVLATQPPPAALLVDLMMPVMDGWQLLEAIGKDPTLPRVPSAVLSAARDPQGLPDWVHLLPKPFDLRDLLRFLRTATGAPP